MVRSSKQSVLEEIITRVEETEKEVIEEKTIRKCFENASLLHVITVWKWILKSGGRGDHNIFPFPLPMILNEIVLNKFIVSCFSAPRIGYEQSLEDPINLKAGSTLYIEVIHFMLWKLKHIML